MRHALLRRPGPALALVAVLAGPAAAQLPEAATHDRIQTRSYRFAEAGTEMGYELFVPSSYDPATATPLIVLLHGLGSTPERVIRYEGLTELAEERGYVVVAPMGYNERGWYGSRGPGGRSARNPDDPENLGELSQMDVMNVLALMREELNVDPERIFLAGHSMGGGGTWHLALTYPDLWAGLAPVAPAIYSSPDALETITELPVIVVQGDEDRLVDVEVTRRWVAKMEDLGMTYRYIEVPGGDHTRIITRTPDNVRAIFDFFDQVGRRRG